ncbi:hypothetical protein DL766_009256 [Monosporascus sp. MC13-8B]|uniref:Uncharacterized protein n=1 Tax=Monosporascus cannonballus TaxID=155416 RepID=A0ABY0GVM8_9PEZI|nr:hypothetical protein DL762_008613 [Monosporascus cannonballus]RYO80718.1 hypothetical protein DL763_008806 [Monosporascus cannonballus]RYP15939.1 hypothetical protein DL766_009256 [Monosporascus sp. MC13-8B]
MYARDRFDLVIITPTCVSPRVRRTIGTASSSISTASRYRPTSQYTFESSLTDQRVYACSSSRILFRIRGAAETSRSASSRRTLWAHKFMPISFIVIRGSGCSVPKNRVLFSSTTSRSS